VSSERINRDELFIGIAQIFGKRSTCLRGNVGAVAVRDGRIIASGYVGAPSGQPHCLEVGCDLQNGHCVRGVHAEANVIAWAARVGSRLEGTTLYSTHGACSVCAKLIRNAGVAEYVYAEPYHTGEGVELLQSMGVKCRQIEN
jgi:dCMP deaminase